MRPIFIVSSYPPPKALIQMGRLPTFIVRQPPRRSTRPVQSSVGRVVNGFCALVAALFVIAGFAVIFGGCDGGRKAPLLAAPELTLDRLSAGDTGDGETPPPPGAQTVYCTALNNSRLDVDGGYFNVAADVPRWSCRGGSTAKGTYQSNEIPDGYTATSAFTQFEWVALGPPSSVTWLTTGKSQYIPDVGGERELQDLVTLQAVW